MEGDIIRAAFEIGLAGFLLGWAVLGVIAFLRSVFLDD